MTAPTVDRRERFDAMLLTISEVLMSGDFNPIGVSVNRPRRPRDGVDGETYWEDTGVVVVTFTGIMPLDDLAIHLVEKNVDDDEGLEMVEDETEDEMEDETL